MSHNEVVKEEKQYTMDGEWGGTQVGIERRKRKSVCIVAVGDIMTHRVAVYVLVSLSQAFVP
jgi:hypothetical protein